MLRWPILIWIACWYQATSAIDTDGSDNKNATTATPIYPSVLLLVISPYLYDVVERDAVRNTWAAEAAKYNIRVLFPFTALGEQDEDVKKAIEEESAYHQDAYIFNYLPDEFDTDMTLTLNTLNWALTKQPSARYYGKVTADIWLNAPKLAEVLKGLNDTTDWIMGRYADNQDEEVKDLYGSLHGYAEMGKGQFALGHFWLMPKRTLKKVIKAAGSVVGNSDIGDAVITGDYRRAMGIPAVNRTDVVNMWDIKGVEICYRENYLAVHGVFYKQKHVMHNQKCD
ncbi:uncharacterized protein LOC129583064 [Paramacrobiotus metropolitanus]|uniref:uncharacterized protein LOC129583064 n=1 Tax=Paramacrobiotus metropolitanus TaxID=2943436 RepID=UPI002446587E|nr:uncharacterized protein LOC129583064 [Paramacrobiotus metropolitanus]